MAGDYGHFARYLEPGALDFLARLDVAPGTRMLDVACGAGQIAIPPPRRRAVTGRRHRVQPRRAGARARPRRGVDARFDEGDAEMQPYEDASFDLVTSLIGAMFAPRPSASRRSPAPRLPAGGRIVMANWTPRTRGPDVPGHRSARPPLAAHGVAGEVGRRGHGARAAAGGARRGWTWPRHTATRCATRSRRPSGRVLPPVLRPDEPRLRRARRRRAAGAARRPGAALDGATLAAPDGTTHVEAEYLEGLGCCGASGPAPRPASGPGARAVRPERSARAPPPGPRKGSARALPPGPQGMPQGPACAAPTAARHRTMRDAPMTQRSRRRHHPRRTAPAAPPCPRAGEPGAPARRRTHRPRTSGSPTRTAAPAGRARPTGSATFRSGSASRAPGAQHDVAADPGPRHSRQIATSRPCARWGCARSGTGSRSSPTSSP
jgi:SAM-dependent methyltransferase